MANNGILTLVLIVVVVIVLFLAYQFSQGPGSQVAGVGLLFFGNSANN